MKLRRIGAILLSTVMLVTTAYGQTTEVPKDTPMEERIITYEEAVELAVKNNTELKNIKDNLEILENNRQKVADGLLGQVIPSTQPQYTVYIESYISNMLTTLNTLETTIKTVGISKDIINESCRLVVKNYMGEISSLNEKIDMMEDTVRISEKSLDHATLKKKLGMISEAEYIKVKNDCESNELAKKLIELTLEVTYNSFGRLLGVKESFKTEFSVEYEVYPEVKDLNEFVNRLVAKDPTLKIADYKISDAEFQKNYVAIDNATTSYEERENKVVTESRSYKDIKADLELGVKNAYTGVRQSELNIENLKIALKQAEENLKNAELSRKVGYITDLEVMGASLAVKKAQYDLEEAIRKHDLAKYTLERPYLLSGSGKQG